MSMNLFTIPANDQSIFYLGQIFGNIGGVLPVTNGPLLLGVMFKVLNTAALSVGAMIVVYTTVAGLLSTASEGEFLGKKWSGLWVPIRTVLGIIGLFPSSGGYCAIQVIIMWLILQGVGLADTLWTTILVFMEKNGGSPYASVSFPNVNSKIKPAMQELFKGLVCYESLAATYERGVDSSNPPYSYLCILSPNDPRCGAPIPAFNPAKTSYNLDAVGAQGCGELKFCDSTVPNLQSIPACVSNAHSTHCIDQLKSFKCYEPNSLSCQLCKAQRQVLPEIISIFDSVAKKFVELDYQYQQFYYYSTPQTINKTPSWIQDFCNAQGLQNKCCNGVINLGPVTMPDPNCSRATFYTNFPPNGSNGAGSVNSDTLKQIYVPYGLLPYTDNVDFISAAVNQYVGALAGAYTNYITTLPPTQLAGWQIEAKNNGWILAGMYYFSIARANASIQVDMGTLPTFSMTVSSPTGKQDSPIKDNRNNIDVMPALFSAISKAGGGDELSGVSSPAVSEISETSWTSTHSMLSSFMSDVTGRSSRVVGKLAENPLYKISAYGYSLMISTQLLFWTTAAMLTVVAGLSSINFQVMGTGMTASPGYEAAKAIWGTISPFWILMLSALFSIGAILGIYLPLIPYTIYIMGAVGWLMATIEAMVAGPIIALGILSPSGQHELLGKSEPAVMIIFNLILRPSLMVFGMMASMFLAVVAVTMINQGFAKVAFDIISAPGLVEGIVFMIAYTSLLMMVLNKVFSLIHVVPEKVLTYIGGQAISYGESEGLAGMKQAMEGGAGAMSGGAKEAGGAGGAGMTKYKQDEAHKKGDQTPKEARLGARPGENKDENKEGD